MEYTLCLCTLLYGGAEVTSATLYLHCGHNLVSFISKQIDKLCTKTATSHAGISSKLLKLAKPSITGSITSLVNTSFTTSVYPDSLKIAQVKPFHKKKITMVKSSYRPVSIIPITHVYPKKNERAMNAQICDFLTIISIYFLSAFRPGYGYQTALLKSCRRLENGTGSG